MSDTFTLPTLYAPAERATQEELQWQTGFISELSSLHAVLDAMPNIVLILNQYRQTIFFNKALFNLVQDKEASRIIGMRPGELLDCIHSCESEGGCGTTRFCSACGAVNAILSSQGGIQSVEECRIIAGSNGEFGALDLRVWATPFESHGDPYTIFAISDISNEKRRAALERIFFHDVLNLVTALQGAADMITRPDKELVEEFAPIVKQLVGKLIEEIESQRDLSAAEKKELHVAFYPIQSLRFLRQVADFYQSHYVAQGRSIRISTDAANVSFVSDASLLQRVIGNMIKNALEACRPGEVVTLGCSVNENKISFWVHNPGFIPDQARLQIFQRSFSTKDQRRGLGTYSMKLLSEHYLNGEISFNSSPEEGTTFVGAYPIKPKTWPD
jgi:nitrogen fixation/metabolism regulation signal transduction histidine kinase